VEAEAKQGAILPANTDTFETLVEDGGAATSDDDGGSPWWAEVVGHADVDHVSLADEPASVITAILVLGLLATLVWIAKEVVQLFALSLGYGWRLLVRAVPSEPTR